MWGWRRATAVVIVTLAVAAPIGLVTAADPATAATLAPINGQGSTYAALAIQTWVRAGQSLGLNVNYTPTNSPAGLSAFAAGQADFAGSEAEYSSVDAGAGTYGNYQYTPDVAGATSVVYNVDLNTDGTTSVDYLHLSRLTIAKIFTGAISNWDSPTISLDNKGLVLPDEPITVIYRTGQSGTTALFYDFVNHTDPTDFDAWATAHCLGTGVRLVAVTNGCGGSPYPHGDGATGSTQQASLVAHTPWTISYDEFGYAKVFHDDVAWVENAAGNWTQPYAKNIAAALKSATLNPDLSQNLTAVYTSTTPTTYPISAYSYIVTHCPQTSAWPSCGGAYTDAGVANTLTKWMEYIECTGQVTMAQIGYSPLPAVLSQDMANAVGRLTGVPPEQLTSTNCANPQERGNLGVGATPPPDPTRGVTSEGSGPGSPAAGSGKAGSPASQGGSTTGNTGSTDGGTGGNPGAAQTNASTGGPAAKTVGASTASGGTGGPAVTTATTPVGKVGSTTRSVGGGTTTTRPSAPTPYAGAVVPPGSPWLVVAVLLFLLVPAGLLVFGKILQRRRRPAPGIDR